MKNMPAPSDRVGRVGSSNAAQIHAIGLRGFINEADKELLALIKGEKESKEFSTDSMKLGLYLEDKVYECLLKKFPDATSNPYYESKRLSAKYGFRIGCHIDYEVESMKRWIEQKSVKYETSEAEDSYRCQLAYETMMLRDKFGKEGRLLLSHYNTEHWADEFDPMRLSISDITPISSWVNHNISVIKKGFQIIKEALIDFVYEPKQDIALESPSLPAHIQDKICKIKEMAEAIKEYENLFDEFKGGLYEMMSAQGVKSIKLLDLGLSFTAVAPTTSTSFDSKAFKNSHPKLYNKFQKVSDKKGYLKMSSKTNNNNQN